MGESIFTRVRRWFQLKPQTLRRLLAANISIYLAWVLILGHLPATRSFVVDILALHPALPGILTAPWQLLSYAFLHLGFGLGGLMHIAFNMLWLVWLGQEYEDLYGSRRMAWLYGVGAVGGGVMTVVLHQVFPGVPAFGGYVHGASGAVIAVIAAVATLQPHKQIGLLLLGVWPLRWVLAVFLGLDVLFGLGGGVSVSAHLGGAVAGILFAKYGHVTMRPAGRGLHLVASKPPGLLRRLDDWIGARGQKSRRSGGATKVQDATIISEIQESDVDRILDKINELGYESLSEQEKRTLYEASREQ